MSLRFRSRIIEHLAHRSYSPSTRGNIAREMNIEPEDQAEFDGTIDALLEAGRLTVGKDDLLRLPHYPDEIVGRFRLNARGFGFIRPDEPYRDGDLFVPRGRNRDAVSGDRVRAEVVRQPGRAGGRGGARSDRSPYVGHIVEVIERGQDHFVGTLRKHANKWVVEPDGRTLFDPVMVRDPHAKNAREGDKVVLELLHYPEGPYVAEGVIVEVLGEAGRPDVETQAVIVAHGLRTEWPEGVNEQARAVTRDFEVDADGPWPDREDLTGVFTFTIDPPDAKDFDDAITIERDAKRDTWTLGIHIADVSHFVPRGSAIDEEAQQRSTSVYLPRYTIPMLPELLSNGVCSLQEGVNRFTKSVFVTLDGRGRVLDQRVANTVIRSDKRLTYLEAQALIDHDEKTAHAHRRTDTPYTDELRDALRLSDQLGRILRERRRRHGMIVLNLPEVELIFDEDGHVIDAQPEDDAFTHTIIEMFMVEANEAVARQFYSLNTAVLRRIHPEPSFGDMQELETYARVAGIKLPEEPTREDLQRLLEKTHETPAARAIHFAALRTLSKASYSPALVGHYALASDHYAHFTSPIRRYPDLTVHRALQAYLELTDNGRKAPGGKKRRSMIAKLRDDNRVLDEAQLVTLGRHCSDMEIEAADAERELRDFLVMQLLKEKHLGDEFDGVIVGVTNTGVFASIEKYLVEGLIRAEDLSAASPKPDRWRLDDRTNRMVAARSGASLGIGDLVTVRVENVNLASRHLDMMITAMRAQAQPARMETTPSRGKGKKSAAGKGGSSAKGRARDKRRKGRAGRRSR